MSAGPGTPARELEPGSWRSRPPGRVAPALALAAACAAGPVPAVAQVADVASDASSPVAVELGPLFARGPLDRDQVVALRVRLENRTGATLDGTLAIHASPSWSHPGAGATAHLVAVPLPAGAARTVVVPVALDGAVRVHATYRAGDAELARVATPTTHRSFALGVVLWPASPALRTAIETVATPPPADGTAPAPPPVPPRAHGPYAVGEVRLDARSGDPALPRDPAGWGSVDAVIASVPAWLRATEAERAALDGWVQAGGHLALSPRGPADLDRPEVRALLADAGDAPYGASRRRGFGAVHALALDVTDEGALAFGPAAVPQLGALFDAILVDRATGGPLLPPLGRSVDPGLGVHPGPRDAALRAGLDPNQRYRAALGLVAVLLAAYVVALSTFGAGWPARPDAPPLRVLVRAPLLALAFTAAFLAIGYLGKGLRSRQLRFELVEAPSGEATATARRTTAFFPTRPLRFDWTADGPAARLLSEGDRLARAVRHEAGAGPRFEGVRAGLWETRFAREDRLRALGGAVTLVADGGGRVRGIDNGLPVPLQDAVLVTAAGRVVPVGDVAPGGRVAVDRSTRFDAGFGVHPGDGRRARFARLLGLDDARRPLADALFAAHPGADRLVRGQEAVLYARLPAEQAPADDGFPTELDLRLLRIALPVPGAAPPPSGATLPVPPYPMGSMP